MHPFILDEACCDDDCEDVPEEDEKCDVEIEDSFIADGEEDGEDFTQCHPTFDAFGEFEDEMEDEDKEFQDAGDPRLFEDCISYEEDAEDDDKEFQDEGDPRLFEDYMACDGETVRVGEEEPAVAMNDEEHRTSSKENAGAMSDEEQPDSSNENESAKMHRYMAAGSFASRELLRQTYNQFFDHQRYKRTPAFQRDPQPLSKAEKDKFVGDTGKIKIPFRVCEHCEAITVGNFQAQRTVKRGAQKGQKHLLYSVRIPEGTCCKKGACLLRDKDILNLSHPDADELLCVYKHPQFFKFAHELNNELSLTCPIIACDNRDGYVEFGGGLHAKRFHGAPFSRAPNQGTRHGVLQGIIHGKATKPFFEKDDPGKRAVYIAIMDHMKSWLTRHNAFYREVEKYKNLLRQFENKQPKYQLHFKTKETGFERTVFAVCERPEEPCTRDSYILVAPLENIPHARISSKDDQKVSRSVSNRMKSRDGIE
jgi:hypothetical protein